MTVSQEIRMMIKDALSKGSSRNQIIREFHLAKNTVLKYAGIKSVPPLPPKIDFTPTEVCGEVVGIFAGDGSQYYEPKSGHYETNIHFGKVNEQYAYYVKEAYEKFFQKRFRLKQESLTKLRIRMYHREIFYFFDAFLDYERPSKHDTVRVKEDKTTPEFKIGFLRGMFDTDGCLFCVPHEKRVRLFYTTTSKELASQISIFLTELGIEHRVYTRLRKVWKTIYTVNIWKSSAYRFINKVKPFKAQILGAGS
ncbi:MAG: LAGLIDADG family homing endonuclease [Nanoarchaeota archaeon]|nr:LAGLIDADG family homing endonuclease [Nanoarchaeota archaeon]